MDRGQRKFFVSAHLIARNCRKHVGAARKNGTCYAQVSHSAAIQHGLLCILLEDHWISGPINVSPAGAHTPYTHIKRTIANSEGTGIMCTILKI